MATRLYTMRLDHSSWDFGAFVLDVAGFSKGLGEVPAGLSSACWIELVIRGLEGETIQSCFDSSSAMSLYVEPISGEPTKTNRDCRGAFGAARGLLERWMS